MMSRGLLDDCFADSSAEFTIDDTQWSWIVSSAQRCNWSANRELEVRELFECIPANLYEDLEKIKEIEDDFPLQMKRLQKELAVHQAAESALLELYEIERMIEEERYTDPETLHAILSAIDPEYSPIPPTPPSPGPSEFTAEKISHIQGEIRYYQHELDRNKNAGGQFRPILQRVVWQTCYQIWEEDSGCRPGKSAAGPFVKFVEAVSSAYPSNLAFSGTSLKRLVMELGQ